MNEQEIKQKVALKATIKQWQASTKAAAYKAKAENAEKLAEAEVISAKLDVTEKERELAEKLRAAEWLKKHSLDGVKL